MKVYNIDQIKQDFPNLNIEWINFVQKVTDRIEKPWNFVGGCVRDSLLGIETLDIDINTLATPEEIEKFMDGLNISVVGKRFGTIGVFYKKWRIEITTTRCDINTYGRKADVDFITSFEKDSERRDFTINALMFNGEILTDYTNGIEDLKNLEITFIKDPEKRIQEDYLRILRYIRFFCRFSKNLDNVKYKDIIKKNLEGLKIISIERVISEIYSMCKYNNTNIAIKILNDLNISDVVFGYKLNENIKDNWCFDKKMAFIFILLPQNIWKKLPLFKSVKYYLNSYILIYDDILKNFSFIWNKYHSLDQAKVFLEIYNELNNLNYEIKIDNNDNNYFCKPEILDLFENKDKSKVCVIIKYLYLNKKEISIEQINKEFDNF